MENWSYKIIILVAAFIIGIVVFVIWFHIPSNESIDSQLISDSISGNNSILKEQINNELYEVYSTVIKDLYIGERTQLLVIDEETTGCLRPIENEKMLELRQQMEDSAIERLSILLLQTVNDFQLKSKTCKLLNSKFSIPIRFVIASKNNISDVFRENDIVGGWRRFYQKYPFSSGLFNFSNVGFNFEMTQAFVYTGRSCGGKCGAGFYVVLEKKQNIWVVVNKFNSWIS